jgi:hypothetical protein
MLIKHIASSLILMILFSVAKGAPVPAGFENITLDHHGPAIVEVLRKSIEINLSYYDDEKYIVIGPKAADKIISEIKLLLKDGHEPKVRKLLLGRNDVSVGFEKSDYDKEIHFVYDDFKNALEIKIHHKHLNRMSISYLHNRMAEGELVDNPSLSIHTSSNLSKNKNIETLYSNVNTTLAYAEYSFNVNSQVNVNNQGENSDVIITNEAYLQTYFSDYIVKAGFFSTRNLLSNINVNKVIGINFLEDKGLINPVFYRSYGFPLYETVASPSTLRIYKDSRLLVDKYLLPGSHVIETDSFPNGAYDISIEIEDMRSGGIEKKTLFFTKNYSLYNSQYSANEFVIGLASENGVFIESDEDDFYVNYKDGLFFFEGNLSYQYSFHNQESHFGLVYQELLNPLINYNVDADVSIEGNFRLGYATSYQSDEHGFSFSGYQKYANSFSDSTSVHTLNYRYNNDHSALGIGYVYRTSNSASNSNSASLSYQLPFEFENGNGANLNLSVQYSDELSISLSFTIDLFNSTSFSYKTNYPSQQNSLRLNYSNSHENLTYSISGENSNDEYFYSGAVGYKNDQVISKLKYLYNDDLNANLNLSTSLHFVPWAVTMSSSRSPSGIFFVSKTNKEIDVEYRSFLFKNNHFSPAATFSKQLISLEYVSLEHTIRQTSAERFFYHGNILRYDFSILKTCPVKISVDITPQYQYIYANNDNNAILLNKADSTVNLVEGDEIVFYDLMSDKKICRTRKYVSCGNTNLGAVSCEK